MTSIGATHRAGTQPRARIDCLDALRGLCALSVALFHFNTTGTLTNLPFVRHAWMLVDFFFVLSGFVITAAYADALGRGMSLRRFLLLRLARIWPLHVVMLLCFVALELSKLVVATPFVSPLFSEPRGLASLLMNVLLLQVFGLYDYVTWNAPSWSIAAEFWVYLLAALCFRFWRGNRPIVAAAIAGTCALVMLASGSPYLNLTYNGAVVRCLYGFSLGALTWSIFTQDAQGRAIVAERAQTAAVATILEILGVTALVAAVWLLDDGPFTIALPWLFAACVLILARQGGALSGLLSHRLPVWLGTISYSIYMTHLFIEGRILDILTIAGQLLDRTFVERIVEDGIARRVVVGSEAFINLTVLALVMLILAVSYGSYRLVEQPCNRWARNRLAKLPAPVPLRAAS